MFLKGRCKFGHLWFFFYLFQGFEAFIATRKRLLTRDFSCVDRRPGILVLINDADWELEGQDAYELQAGDEVVFVSTLHGG